MVSKLPEAFAGLKTGNLLVSEPFFGSYLAVASWNIAGAAIEYVLPIVAKK
jgi:hypothetical protein